MQPPRGGLDHQGGEKPSGLKQGMSLVVVHTSERPLEPPMENRLHGTGREPGELWARLQSPQVRAPSDVSQGSTKPGA